MEICFHDCIGVTFDDGVAMATPNRRFVFHRADGTELRITLFAPKSMASVPVQKVQSAFLAHQLEAGYQAALAETNHQPHPQEN